MAVVPSHPERFVSEKLIKEVASKLKEMAEHGFKYTQWLEFCGTQWQ
jgi:hypothetical protein